MIGTAFLVMQEVLVELTTPRGIGCLKSVPCTLELCHLCGVCGFTAVLYVIYHDNRF